MAQKPSYEALEKKIESLTRENRGLGLMLKERDSFGTNLLAKAPNPVLVINPDRTIRFVNHAFEKLTGFEANEIVGLKDPFPWWLGERIHRTQADFDGAMMHGIEKGEALFKKKSGETFTVEISLKPIFEGKRLAYHLANWVDVSDRKKAESAIHGLNERLTMAADSAGIGVWELNIENNVLMWDHWMYRLYGVDPESFEGAYETWQRSVHPDDRERADALVQRAIQGEKPFDAEFRIVRPNGEIRILKAFARVVKNENGIPLKMTGVNYDITEQKAVEASLVESERKWRNILIHTPQIGISLDRHARIVFANKRFLLLTGWKEDEVMGRDWFEMFIPEKVRNEVRKVFRTVIAQEETSGFSNYENEIVTKRGDLINVAWSNVLTKDLGGNVIDVTCLGVDLTERRRSEKALRESEAKYRAMMETIKDPVYICSEDYRVQYMNQAMVERIGEDGTGAFCFKALHGFDEKCPWCQKEEIHRKGYASKDIVSPKDKRSFSVSNAIFDNDDGSRSTISVFRDTTDFKQLQDRLQQAQKMESIGNVAGGIAHDFNNILFPILGLSELLLEDLSTDSVEYRNVQQIMKSGERGRELIGQILAFSRQSEHQMMPVRVQQVVREVLTLCRSTIPANIEITQFVQGNCGFVLADGTQLHQIVMNLMTNAYHAVEQIGGTISVRLEEKTLTLPHLKTLSLKPGKHVALSVSDTGHGIAPAVMHKIYDPYFTTKEKTKGTGLGLAVVFGIVKEHGGDIEVQSEVGKGTTFNVYLPLLTDISEPARAEKTQIQPRGTERILLVDDEEPVLRLEKIILERLGYRVEVRNNSIGALGAFGADPTSFDLVITDMAMPKMTGDQLAEQMMAIRPGIPIILITGFSDRIDGRKAKRIGIKGFLPKPVKKADLANLVRKLLDEAKTPEKRA